jgi:hypothetical protein
MALTPEDYLRFALRHSGDSSHGKQLFRDREGSVASRSIRSAARTARRK